MQEKLDEQKRVQQSEVEDIKKKMAQVEEIA